MYDCQRCGRDSANIHYGSETETELLCIDCYNAMMSEVLGIKVDSYPEGISIRDGNGKVRHFSIKKRLHHGGFSMEAKEIKSFGYRFVVQGELECDQGQLLLQLIDKAERAIMETFIEEGQFPNGQRYQFLKNDCLVGIVE